ncbi:MAG TPA: hemolysin family protein [Actinomycetota bacterium]|nr:hemolysin family protein [Actinomycetota bacterium]
MTVWKIVAVLALVGANAFFVAAEFGLVAVRRTRIEELVAAGSRRALSTQKALQELNLMLSGCQLGITFASLGLGAIGEPALAHLFEGAFRALPSPLDTIATHGTAVAIAFAIITFLHVVLGELVPKNLSIARPEATALWVATPMRFFAKVFKPLIWLFNETANVTLGAFGIESKSEIASLHTPDEIAIIVEESRKGGTIESEQSRILTKMLEFPEKRAIEAMVPRVGAQPVPIEAGLEELLDLAEKTGFSRFPVWRARPDEFVGVVHLKDMLKESRSDPNAKVKDAMREALLVPESLPLEDVLVNMRRNRNHFAIVLDEFGATSGILTLEDIIEELVGEIRDESDAREKDLRPVKGGLRIPGTMRPDELKDATGVELPEGDYETVAGFILEKLGRLAKRGDEVEVNGTKIRVANVRQRRILSVDIQLDHASPILQKGQEDAG